MARSWDDVLGAVRADPLGVPVVDPYWSGRLEVEALRGLVGMGLSHPVIYASFDKRPVGAEMRCLRECGVQLILTQDADDSPAQIVSAVTRAFGAKLLERLSARAALALNERERLVVVSAMREGWREVSVADLGYRLGVSPRTLRRWLARVEPVGPQDVMHWARVVRAATWISFTGLGVEDVAAALEFPDTRCLRRRYLRLVGQTLTRRTRREVFGVAADGLASQLGGVGVKSLTRPIGADGQEVAWERLKGRLAHRLGG